MQNESTLNHKHSDLTKTNVRDCLKMISKDYEKKLKSLNPNNYKYEHIVVHELKQLEYKVDHEIKDMLANVEHSKASQISYTMTHTPEPDWLHTIEEDGLAYYTECSGEQNLYRLSMSGSLMQVGSYKRERDEDGYKVRVLTFLSEPVLATEPAMPGACNTNTNTIATIIAIANFVATTIATASKLAIAITITVPTALH